MIGEPLPAAGRLQPLAASKETTSMSNPQSTPKAARTYFKFHRRAGTGFILVETREEQRALETIAAECPDADIVTVAAPGGAVRPYRLKAGVKPPAGAGLQAAYAWAADAPGRIVVIWDLHTLINNAGQWRAAIDATPYLRSPKDCGDNDAASLAIAIGPSWELLEANPLKGAVPVIEFAPPDRATLADLAKKIGTSSGIPLNGHTEAIADALCGLTADAAQQAAAECLSAHGDWNPDHLRGAKRKMVSDAGLLIVPGIREIAGLQGFKDYAAGSLLPWARDAELGVRRIFLGGKPGTGKTFAASYLAGQMGCDLAVLDVSQLQGSLVGQSQAATRAATKIADAIGTEAPFVVLMDEFDCIAKTGNDGGAASGQWSWLVGWLQRTLHHQTVIIACSNYPDRVDAAMLRRFPIRFRFEYPDAQERQQVAEYHFKRVRIADPAGAAKITAGLTEGCSSAQLAEEICPEVTRRTARKAADLDTVRAVVSTITPAANVNTDQLAAMERAVAGWRLANTPAAAEARPTGRRIGRGEAN
jgi:hypothetical protein